MWIVLAVVALFAVGAALVTMFRRPRGDDLNSVRSYHSALGTLEHLSERTGRSAADVGGPSETPSDPVTGARTSRRSTAGTAIPHVDPVGPGARQGVGPRTTARPGPVPPVPVRGNDEFPDPETPLVFDDSRPKDRYLSAASGDAAPPARAERAQRHALDSMNHRPRRSMTVMIVVAALVLFGVLAYAGSKRSAPTSHAKAASATTSVAASTPKTGATSTTVRSGAGGHHTRTTVPPAPTRIVASSSTAYSATYPVTTSSFRITVTGTGQCWVSATTVSSGSTLWAGTVQAGTVQVIQATGATSVQLGTPAATLAINRVPVVFPTPALSPFVATFEPSAASSAGPVTSTTTTTVSGATATSPSTTGASASG